MNDKVKQIVEGIKEKPIRFTYSYPKLQKQYNATNLEVRSAKMIYRDYGDKTPNFMINEVAEPYIVHTLKTDKDGTVELEIQDNSHLENPGKLLRLVKLNPDEFEVTSFWRGFRANGKWWASVKAKPIGQEKDYKKAFKDHLSEYPAIKYPEIIYEEKSSQKMAVVCLFDIHLGKLGLFDYTGDIDVSANEVMIEFAALRYFLQKQEITKILLPIGNDFFNADNPRLAITKGIVMDNDPNMYRVFKAGLNLARYMIEELIRIAPVEVVLVAGNHATYTEILMATALSQIFRDTPNVTVEDTPKDRKYLRFGKVLLGLTHGIEKPEKYANLLPYEAKEYFSMCNHFEILVGDKHHEKIYKNPVHELDGVVVRQLGALTRTDRWHDQKGFTLAKRRSYVLVYDEHYGLELQYTNNAN